MKKGKGWRGEPFRHSLAGQGISTYRLVRDRPDKNKQDFESQKRYGTVTKQPLFPTYKGDYKNRYKKHRVVLNYPDNMKEGDRFNYNMEMSDESLTPEDRQEIYDRWQKWKEWRSGKGHIHRIISNLEFEDNPYRPYYVTNSNYPPEGYRWVDDESEIKVAEGRLLGKFYPDLTYEEFDQFMTFDEFMDTTKVRPTRTRSSTKRKVGKKTPGREEMQDISEQRLSAYRSHKDRRIEELEERRRSR